MHIHILQRQSRCAHTSTIGHSGLCTNGLIFENDPYDQRCYDRAPPCTADAVEPIDKGQSTTFRCPSICLRAMICPLRRNHESSSSTYVLKKGAQTACEDSDVFPARTPMCWFLSCVCVSLCCRGATSTHHSPAIQRIFAAQPIIPR